MIFTAGTEPKRVAVFNRTVRLRLQIVGPFTVRIGTNKDEVSNITNAGLKDGIQINQATGIYKDWWSGELWMCATVPNSQVLIITTDGTEVVPTCV